MSKKVLCPKCNNPEFEYDSYWNEFSCKRCGWIVEDSENVLLIKNLARKNRQPECNDKGKGKADIHLRNDKPSVKKIILFGMDIPKAKKTKFSLDKLFKAHPELKFLNFDVINEILPKKSMQVQIKRLDIGKVTNYLINSFEKTGGIVFLSVLSPEDRSNYFEARVIDIAALITIDDILYMKHGFIHSAYPNRLLLQRLDEVDDDASYGYYVLILDSDIDVSTYYLHEPMKTLGIKLSSIYEAIKDQRIF